MATVGDVIQSGDVISKYVSASIDFSAASNGDNVYGATTWEEPRVIRGVQLHCQRTVALANGTNTTFAVEIKVNPSADQWYPLVEAWINTATVLGIFSGFSWTNANTVCSQGAPIGWSNQSTGDTATVLAYGMRLRVNRDAGDATLAGTITDVWLSTIPAF